MAIEAVLQSAKIDWSQGAPFSLLFNDIYFSRQDGLEETRYTFIDGNQLLERWQALESDSFTIAETGFGTALNFLSTAQHWSDCQSKTAQSWLHYFSIEKFPLTFDDLKRACECWPELNALSTHLLAHYPIPVQGVYQIIWPEKRIKLTLLWMDVAEALAYLMMNKVSVDAWYLDGFAPAKNPDIWQQSVIEPIAQCSNAGTTFATFTAAGFVRRALIDAGFCVKKRKGFGSKREMLTGEKLHTTERKDLRLPWLNLYPKSSVFENHKSIAVIGSGIAGATTARALAESGLHVEVFEKDSGIAEQASGNSAGIFYPYLTADLDENSQFFVQAYHRLLHDIAHYQLEDCVNQCGMLKYSTQTGDIEREIMALSSNPDTARWVRSTSPDFQSGSLSNGLTKNAIFYPLSGYFEAKKACKKLLAHPLITVHLHSEVTNEIDCKLDSITLQINGIKRLFSAAVFCNSYEFKKMGIDHHLPSMKVRGQTELLQFKQPLEMTKHVICDDIYLIPLPEQRALIGATFDRDNPSLAVSEDSRRELLTKFNLLLDKFKCEKSSPELLLSKVGIRFCSLDRLPFVGPVYDLNQIKTDYQLVGKGQPLSRLPQAQPIANLYANVAHGARGITSSFLSAQIILAMINRQSLPIHDKILARISPLRALLRQLKKSSAD